MKATQLGRFLRKLRIEHGIVMKDMADTIGCTSSYLSAVELGKKNITQDFLSQIKSKYGLNESEVNDLEAAASYSAKDVMINLMGRNDLDREVVVSFARKLDSLSDQDKIKLKSFFED